MKNPSVSAALVLIGLALVVGGFAWLSADSSTDDQTVGVVTRPEGEQKVGFVALSPREERKKGNMEATLRELHRIREVGEEVHPGVFRIKDETGDPTFYLGDLVPGKGRDGEPMFMSVQFKKMPAPPLKSLNNKNHKKIKGFDPTKRTNALERSYKQGDSTKGAGGSGADGGVGSGAGPSGSAGGGGSGGGDGKGAGPK